jgi:hypothetical protein
MEWMYWLVLAVANAPVFFVIGWVIFDDWEGFLESLKYLATPDWWSWLRGEGIEDWWAELKFFFWVIGCGLVVYGEHWAIQRYDLF